jgi:CTP:molybdopterin cytidylyltransferase MocA
MNGRPDPAVFAVVFAAGTASRFGATKQLARYQGAALVRRATRLATEICGERTALIVGHDWQAVYEACAPLDGFLIINEAYADGLGTSIARAIKSLEHVADAVIIILADQPLITVEHLQALLDCYTGAPDQIVATQFSGTLGPPCLYSRGCFTDLAELDKDSGGRHLLRDRRFQINSVPFEPARVDIDRPSDLDAIN